MKKLIPFIFIVFLFSNCQSKKAENTTKTDTVSVSVYETFSTLEPRFKQENDTIYVVNFWATTCGPCIKEMPHFNELEKTYQNEKLHIILVSLDMKKHLDTRVIPFAKKHKLLSEVLLLADANYSAWTDEIDPSWFGALPATLIIKNGKRKFFFGAFDEFNDLEKEIKPFISETN